jgi:hypothetical protein
MLKAASTLAPGEWVRLPAEPDWGLGQVQSVAGFRVTVNFEHAGKRLVHTDRATLESVVCVPGRHG